MEKIKCTTCGHETAPDGICPFCTHANGTVTPIHRGPPPEVAGWVIEPVPPEIAEHFRETFSEDEYWAEFHEAMRTGGADIEALLGEVERIVHGKQ